MENKPEVKISKQSVILMFIIIFIVIPTIITGLYRCPSLKNHHNMKCDVCGSIALNHWNRGGVWYELCDKHYTRWMNKDLCDAKYYQRLP